MLLVSYGSVITSGFHHDMFLLFQKISNRTYWTDPWTWVSNNSTNLLRGPLVRSHSILDGIVIFYRFCLGGVGNLRTSEAEVTTGGPDKLRFFGGWWWGKDGWFWRQSPSKNEYMNHLQIPYHLGFAMICSRWFFVFYHRIHHHEKPPFGRIFLELFPSIWSKSKFWFFLFHATHNIKGILATPPKLPPPGIRGQ